MAARRPGLLDNLREGVLKPDVYEPELNPLYVTCCATTASSRCPRACVIRTARGRSSVKIRPSRPLPV